MISSFPSEDCNKYLSYATRFYAFLNGPLWIIKTIFLDEK